MNNKDKKEILKKKLGLVVKKLRGRKSQFILGSEYDISSSLLSTIERGLKDPQYTTFYRIAEALNVKPSQLMSMIEETLPDDFTFVDI